MSAAIEAGIERVSLLQEPVAAAMAYGLGNPLDEQPAILVFDLGGGTFDVSLLHNFEGIMEVVASDGNNQLGGFDLDTELARFVIEASLSPEDATQVWSIPQAIQTIRTEAERCKIALSTEAATQFTTPPPHSIDMPLTQANLAQVSIPFLERLWHPLKALAASYGLAYAHHPDGSELHTQTSTDRFAPPPRTISQLVLVGGATAAPVVSEFAERVVGASACTGVDPEHCVALGAAIQAGLMEGTVTRGLEMMDSVYVQELQGRASGFQI